MFWLTIALFAASLILSEVLAPKPDNERQRPAGLGDFNFPTATEGRAVPLIWGTVKLDGPNVVWYGDLRQRAVKDRVKTGLFSSTEITTGYLYFIGIQFGLCRGQVDSLLRVWIGDDVVYDTEISSGSFEIDEPKLFGGITLGQGGVSGTVSFFNGAPDQTASSYISQFQQQGGDTPTYHGTCYCVFEHGYIGNSTSIKPWAFEVRRLPLGPDAIPKNPNGGNDANPAHVLYEILTNTEWGLGFPESDIDSDSFEAAADTLRDEGNGFSFVLDNQRELNDLVDEIQRQIDGSVFLDQSTGQWTIGLARDDYTVSALLSFSESTSSDIEDFTRGSWDDTVNYVTVEYTDRSKDYFKTFSLAQDMANIRIQSTTNKTNISFPGVKDKTLANSLAWRELRQTAFPLAKATVIVGRQFWNIKPTDVIRWTSTALGFTDLVMRVTRVDTGDLTNGRIRLTLIQDVYSTGIPSFGDPIDSGWTPPSNVPLAIPAAQSQIFEAPRAFIIRDTDALTRDLPHRVWASGRFQFDASVEYDLRTRIDANVFETERTIDDFMLIGRLTSTLNPEIITNNFQIEPDPDGQQAILDAIESVDEVVLGNDLPHLIMIDSELMLVTSSQSISGSVRLNNVFRGVLDTAIAVHGANSSVYLLSVGGGIGSRSFAPGDDVDVKLVTRSPRQDLSESSAVTNTVTMDNRHIRPYPPIGYSINNGSDYPSTTQSLDAGTGDDSGVNITYRRKDYTEFQENKIHLGTDAAPSNTTTQYRGVVYDSSNNLLFRTDYVTFRTINVERTEILRNTAGVIPTSLRVDIETMHEIDSVAYNALQSPTFTFNTESTELSGDFNLGVLSSLGVSNSWTAPDAGDYDFTLGTATTSGSIEARINGGGWSTIISSGNTTGTLTNVSQSDTIEVRANGFTLSGREASILLIDSPVSATDAYAIFEE